jgi:hypothetical protein
VGSRAVIDAVVKRKITSPRPESNPRTPIVHPVKYRLSYHGSIWEWVQMKKGSSRYLHYKSKGYKEVGRQNMMARRRILLKTK